MEYPPFLMIEATPNLENREDLQSYLSQAPAITRKHGGIPVATYDVEKAIDSGEIPSVFAVMSFPNRDSVHELFNDPEYQKLIPLRDKGFKSIRYFICNEKI